MSDILVGLLSAVLATNPPQAVSNLVVEKTGISIPTSDLNDPVEKAYYKLLQDDNAAEQDVLQWTDNAEAFDKAVGKDPNITLHMRIQQRLDAVRKEYQDFVQLHPRHVNGHIAFGSFLNDTKDEDAAAGEWEKARQLAPTNPATWNNLANLYGHRGPVKKAFAYYAKAIELDPTQTVYYHNYAVTVYLFRKDAREYFNLTEPQVFDKALGLYREAIKRDPDNFTLFSDYAESFYGTNPPRWKDGLEAWTEALKIAHDDVEREGVYIHLARINLKLGRFDEATLRLNGVTNEHYAPLKKLLTRNLNQAIAKASTNAPPNSASAK